MGIPVGATSEIMTWKRILASVCLAGLTVRLGAVSYVPSSLTPPVPSREFRGAWVATVGNLTWPSKPGLSTAQQKVELIALLDRAVALKLNALIFQVRPSCDALYRSRLEPWSEYLTGTMGQAPAPFYDPLELAVAEAHKRGLELHAWFNPYRARHTTARSPISAAHVSRTHPELVRTCGKHLWLDPGDPRVQDYSLEVVLDVVRRYDIDGVHFDDYFYPYKEKDAGGMELDFPDEASWRKHGVRSGLSRADWRRENVNTFLRRVCQAIHSAKPWVKFGLSPFGIWRPGNPPQIRGLDTYEKLFTDSRHWLAEGWCDYCAPQLYWPIDAREQSFTALLDWWLAQNPKGRHVWPGLNSAKVGPGGWSPSEIVSQVRATRQREREPGAVHWSMSALMGGHSNLGAQLVSQCYGAPALVPASPWMGSSHLHQPSVSVRAGAADGLKVLFKPAPGDKVWRWVLQLQSGATWTTHLASGGTPSATLPRPPPKALAITPIDRFGNAGPAVVLEAR